jgi:hypothetical protein
MVLYKHLEEYVVYLFLQFNMEAACSSETLLCNQKTVLNNYTEDRNSVAN